LPQEGIKLELPLNQQEGVHENVSVDFEFEREGNGIMSRFPGTGTFTGRVQNKQPHGFGRILFQCCCEYEGEFFEGQFRGQGSYFYDGNIIYSGSWRDNRMHGEGTRIWTDGNHRNVLVYRGSFERGEITGIGELSWGELSW